MLEEKLNRQFYYRVNPGENPSNINKLLTRQEMTAPEQG